MAVKIRLRRMGARGRAFYRVVVADSRMPRDGRFIDQLGYYDPCTDPATIKIDEDRALLWLGRGAQPTDTAAALLKEQSIMQKFLASKEKEKEAPSTTAAEQKAAEEEAPKPPAKRKRTKKAVAKDDITAEAETPVESEAAVEAQST